MRFLIDHYGLDAVPRFYRTGNTTGSSSARDVKAAFGRVLGVSFENAKAEWLAMLRSG